MTRRGHLLTRWAGLAAAVAGVIFIGGQIHHPYLDASSITTTEMVILVGITGMYLRQVRPRGVLGWIGYLLLSACYAVIMCTSFVAAYVLPSIAGTDTRYELRIGGHLDLLWSTWIDGFPVTHEEDGTTLIAVTPSGPVTPS